MICKSIMFEEIYVYVLNSIYNNTMCWKYWKKKNSKIYYPYVCTDYRIWDMTKKKWKSLWSYSSNLLEIRTNVIVRTEIAIYFVFFFDLVLRASHFTCVSKIFILSFFKDNNFRLGKFENIILSRVAFTRFRNSENKQYPRGQWW